MSLLRSFSQGSFLSDQTLLRIREGYWPMPPTPDAAAAFEHWTARAATQHEATIARELAGLSEAELAELAAEFKRTPRRLRRDRLRLSFPGGAVLLLLAGLTLVLDASVLSPGVAGISLLLSLAIGCLAAAVMALGIAALAAFSMMPLEVAHGQVGLSCGLLDEQHPWLYKAAILQRNQAADAYRQRVLGERGPLRGIDYLMMREIARASDAMQMTRVAKSLVAQLNAVDAPVQVAIHAPSVAPTHPPSVAPTLATLPKEPRLVAVAVQAADAATEGTGRGAEDALHAASVTVIGATPADRRREG